MARINKSYTVGISVKDADAKLKLRTLKSIDPQITDATIVGLANLVNSFDQEDLQKPTLTRVDEIEIGN
ncbi:hypothetical protein [Lacticaseibacillus porcinae]|uniref:hypothetical protein n=1 Tax=Lacticaseibacillus porcinae TaxID=1123687 RepID=UPI000F769C6C|nr:hypothetical protein [Lacticaseibacillus porcinae]